MKQLVLTMTAALLMGSMSATAQNRVKNLYTETQQLKVEQVLNTEQPVQLSRYLMAGYNTLCLPLSMDAQQLAATAKGIRVECLEAIRQEGNVLSLYFVDCTDQGIEAGVPYLVFSPTAQYLRARNTEANAAGTELRTIRMSDGQGNQVAFGSSWELRTKEGLYGIPAKQNVAVLESVLIQTTSDQSFLPTRCGFNWEEQAPSATKLEIKHASQSDVTAIKGISRDQRNADGEAYDLNGRRLSAPVKGINIIGGKKVIR